MERKLNRPADRIKALADFYIAKKVFRGMKTFEEACGLSPRYVRNICATTHGNPGVDTIVKIYRTFRGINLEWLVLGDGDMFTVSEEDAIRAGRDATDELKKEEKVRSVLQSKAIRDLTMEEKLELVKRVLSGK